MEESEKQVSVSRVPLNAGWGDVLRRIFWAHQWRHPINGNPYRRFCTVCGEQQEYDKFWEVWNEGDHTKHFESPNVI